MVYFFKTHVMGPRCNYILDSWNYDYFDFIHSCGHRDSATAKEFSKRSFMTQRGALRSSGWCSGEVRRLKDLQRTYKKLRWLGRVLYKGGVNHITAAYTSVRYEFLKTTVLVLSI
uniref:AlNc14C271G9969 protein n=1 Tax=Albugo laibachii Nc14 TaxID=890382 RepID=F0WUE9_9STRA|nr:AlNc14C271G9969 [Albugo laibachii Nc14]|eukprot:CCA25029.1 AlNc14C271G9969 [Albugo laibachii Nc14]